MATAEFSFALGGTGGSSSARRSAYVSRSTNGFGVRVRPNGGAFGGSPATPGAGNVAAAVSLGSPNCVTGVSPARTCTVVISAPVGYDDFEVIAWDAAPVSGTFGGNQLSSVLTLNQLVAANLTNAIALTLNGVVANVALNLSPSSLVSGTAATTTLNVYAKDAVGNIIIAPGTYSDANGTNKIGRITPAGTVTEFSAGITAGAGPQGITSGPDGNLWFTESAGNRIGRITPSGTVTEFSNGLTANANVVGITAGPDGNLWFTENTDSRIGKLVP